MSGIPIFKTPTWNGGETVFALKEPAKKSIHFPGCICDEICLIPHAHGTHIEGRGHIMREFHDFPLSLAEPIQTIILDEGGEVGGSDSVPFVMIRKENPKMKSFQGIDTNYIPRLIESFPSLCILGINEPSFDPEFDEGRLEFHKAFFDSLPDGYLVELLDFSNGRIECNYMYECNLNPYFITETDAIPCCPILYPCWKNKNA